MLMRIDNNNLTVFDRDFTGVSIVYIGFNKFIAHQNEISEFKPGSVGRLNGLLHNSKGELFRIDNNRLDFKNLIYVVTKARDLVAYKSARTPGNPDCVFDYFSQKPLGGDYTEEILAEGTSKTVSFNLSHADNVYTWQLNGVDVPLTSTNNYTFQVNEQTAGVWRCKITNPKLPDVTLYSYDTGVFMQKNGNNAINDVSFTQEALTDNFPEDAIVGEFTATDPDGNTVYYRLPDKILDNSHFRIKNGNTLVSAEPLFDRIYIEDYKIKVIAYDIYGAIFEKEFTITKDATTGADPLPSNITLSNNAVNENEMDANIGDVTIVDNNGFTLELPNNTLDNANFYLDGNTLKTRITFDFELKNQYVIRLSAIKGSQSLKKDFVINVLNVNDNPNEIIITNNSIFTQKAAGTLVGFLVASDQDPEDTEFTFELVNSLDDFVIDGTRLISKRTFTDVETKTITVKATDPRGAFLDQTIDIFIKDESNTSDNLPPRGIGLSNYDLLTSTAINTEVANIILEDENDDLGSFDLLTGLDADYFTINGNKLSLVKTIDKAVFQIKIKGTDGEFDIERTFKLRSDFTTNTTPTNIAPTNIGLSNYDLLTSTAINTEVANIILEDENDDLGSFDLLTGLDADYFTINGNKLSLVKTIDKAVFQIKIKGTDGEFNIERTFKLRSDFTTNTTPTNIAPTNIGLSNYDLLTSTAINTEVANIILEDENDDLGSFDLLTGLDADYFAINGNKLSLIKTIDKAVFQIKIKGTDGEFDIEKTFKLRSNFAITTGGGNNNVSSTEPTAIGLSNLILVRSWTTGTVVSELFMKDEDRDDAIFSLATTDDNTYFEIDGQFLKLRKDIDNAHDNRFEITITAEDESGNKIVQEVELFIIHDTPPVAPLAELGAYPNPVEDILTIRLNNNLIENFNIRIVDISGRVLFNETIEKNTVLYEKQLGVSAYQQGVYFVQVNATSSTIYNKRAVKFLKK